MSSHRFAELPPVGAWQLLGAYQGFEVVRFASKEDSTALVGTTVGVEEGIPWTIHYVIQVASDWHVRRATVTDYAGNRLEIQTDGAGSWLVNGEHHPDLAGCLDLDFEASVVTNTLPVHRLALPVGHEGDSSAAYIRTIGLAVERLDQTYRRLPDVDSGLRFDYRSPRFGYRDTLRFGADGLTADYPDIGLRLPLSSLHPG